MKIYPVGGFVRDKIMNIKSNDIDYVVVGADIKEMQALGFKQVGKKFPVFINPENKCEYALARKEIKTGPKHTDFNFIFDKSITLEEDLKRRDFTCNALAYDKDNNKIIDYHNGIADIKNKTLRHINSTHFVEDPLRVLRMCRFAAQLNFDIADETMQLATEMVANKMLQHLSAERIWQELLKALKSENFHKFILSARQCGALKEILPEIEQMFSTPENPKTHPEGNVGEHTILAVKYVATCSPKVKFASLMHDTGKILTPKEQLPSHLGHEKTGPELINKICSRLKVPNSFKNFAADACRYHGYFYHLLKLTPEDLYLTLSALKKYDTDEIIAVFRSDYFGRALQKPAEKQQEKEQFFKKAMHIFKNIKTCEMPNFAELQQDKDFSQKLKEYKIKTLINKLTIS